jgi:hypothetical protein
MDRTGADFKAVQSMVDRPAPPVPIRCRSGRGQARRNRSRRDEGDRLRTTWARIEVTEIPPSSPSRRRDRHHQLIDIAEAQTS